MGLADLARAAVPLVDSFARLIEAHDGVSVSCAKGCGACCRQLVTISLPEAFALADTLAGKPETDRPAFQSRLAQAETRLAVADLDLELDSLGDPEFPADEHYELARRYFRLGLPCPFLVDESCSIYTERPALCRQYLVSSPAAHCSDPFRQTVTPINPVPQISESLAGVSAQLLETELEFDAIARSISWTTNRSEDAMRVWNADHIGNLFVMHLEMRMGMGGEPV